MDKRQLIVATGIAILTGINLHQQMVIARQEEWMTYTNAQIAKYHAWYTAALDQMSEEQMLATMAGVEESYKKTGVI